MNFKRALKELTWLLAIVLVSLLYKYLLLPIVAGNNASDINQHDTYYINSPHNILWILIPGLCFIVYLIRAITTRLKNPLVLVILTLSTFLVAAWFCHLT